MADQTRFITYYIVLTDPDLVKQYQLQFPNGYQFAPFNPHDNATGLPGGAAVAFNAPWAGSFPGTDPSHVASGTYFGPAPYTWSPEWTSANNYDCTVASFERKTGGFWGMGGTTTRYYWLGQFVLDQPAQPTVGHVTPPSPTPPPTRRLIEGFEWGASLGINMAQGGGITFARDAARHVGGYGMAMRGCSFKFQYFFHNQFGMATTARNWERLYIRLRKADPSNTVIFWGTIGSAGSQGVALAITPDNRIAIYNGTIGSQALIGTTAPLTPWTGLSDDHAWHKLDMIIRYNPNENPGPPIITDGGFQLYLDGNAVFSVDGLTGAGLGQSPTQERSYLGNPVSQTNVMEIDVDDWMIANWPGGSGAGNRFPLVLNGADWLQGSKIVAARWKANGAADANWAGDGRIMLADTLNATNVLTRSSSTANAPAEANLDIDQIVARDDRQVGVTAFAIVSNISQATVGKLGYKLNGGAAVMTVTAGTGLQEVLKSLADGVSSGLSSISSLTARYEKANDANAAQMSYLGASIELIGTFGQEDYRTSENGPDGTPAFARFVGQHNAPYPNSIFAKASTAPPPNSPVEIISGTYVGNGTGQDITFRTPPHFIVIRNTAAAAAPFWWWSTMQNAHRGDTQAPFVYLARVDEDTTFVPGAAIDTQQQRYRMRIVGSDANINQNAITYHYIAFCDAGARFSLAGELQHPGSGVTTIDNNLINPNFTPEAMFMFPETNDGSATATLLFKGVGVAADTVLRMTTTAQLAAALTFGLGKLTTQNALHGLSSSPAFPYILFRRADGNNDPGQGAVMALLGWTGDGGASRTISISPATGKRPIFAVVATSDAGAGAIRDASHTTNTSTTDAGSSSTTHITGGGIDSLSVGSSLNANGTVYAAFVLIGDATAGNGGFGVDGDYIPVAVAPPADGPFPFPTLNDFIVVTTPVVLVGEPDLVQDTNVLTSAINVGGLLGGSPCETYTRALVNRALSRIGITRPITDLVAESSEAAALARTFVKEDINRTLRDFPWPFATAYANLVLVSGSASAPANNDWTYTYRAPNAMMFARRIAKVDKGRRFDAAPIAFRQGIDTGGAIIYCNELATATVPLVLEYTVRVDCPAFFGDALFRDALMWRFGASLAPLSRDKTKQEFCETMYRDVLERARTVDAKEQQQEPNGDADWISGRN